MKQILEVKISIKEKETGKTWVQKTREHPIQQGIVLWAFYIPNIHVFIHLSWATM